MRKINNEIEIFSHNNFYVFPKKKDNSPSNLYGWVCTVEHSTYTFLH